MQVAGAIDIVILNFNNRELLQKCIESIKENTEGGYNIIIVDQGSHDGSREWLQQENIAPHLVLNKRNVGCAEGRNQGIKVGKNEWIVCIDSDIEIKDKEWLDKMWNYTIDESIGVIEAKVRERTWDAGKDKFGGMAFCMIRRKCFERVGEFDKHFQIGEDLEWWTRLEWSSWKTAYCATTDILHKKGGTIRNGCLKERSERLVMEADLLLRYKYGADFRNSTLEKNIRRRRSKNFELIGGTETFDEEVSYGTNYGVGSTSADSGTYE